MALDYLYLPPLSLISSLCAWVRWRRKILRKYSTTLQKATTTTKTTKTDKGDCKATAGKKSDWFFFQINYLKRNKTDKNVAVSF